MERFLITGVGSGLGKYLLDHIPNSVGLKRGEFNLIKHKDFDTIIHCAFNKENTITSFIRISNAKENKIIKTYLLDYDLEVLVDTIEVHNKIDHYKLLPYIQGQKIKFEIYDSKGLIETKIFSVENLEQNGLFTIK